MVGKFILGAIFGGVVVTGGLVIGTVLYPPPHGTDAANSNVTPEASAPIEAPEPVAAPVAEPEAATVEPAPEPAAAMVEATAEPEPPEPDAAPEAIAASDPAVTPEPTPAPEPTADSSPAVTDATPADSPVTEAAPATQDTATAEPSAEGSPASAPAPQAPAEPPAPETPTPEAPAPVLAEIAPVEPPTPDLPGTLTLAEAPAPDLPATPVQPPAPLTGAAATEVEASTPEPAPTPDTPAEAPAPTPLPEPVAPPAVETELAELLPEPPPPAADPEAPASTPETDTEAPDLPGSASEAMPGTRPAALPGTPLAPEATGTAPATGVITGRLPRIGDAPPAEPEVEIAEAAPADDRPVARFAAPFENPDLKPLVAIVLIDTGAPDLDRAGLAALPFPVSFALDPLDPATPDHAALYRAAGREVVMLATGLPQGAQPSDVEVAFQSMAQNLPEAVAVMDLATGGFQNDRPLASLVVPVVQDQGRGLVTWDAGLNAADQVARRADLAATTIFRDLAAGGTDRFALRRTLERVLFKAGQEGRVAVTAEATPDLVAGLLEWTIEGRGATVALAPLTAVLTVD